MPPLNNFSKYFFVFFFQKNRNFCYVTQLDFLSNSKEENTAKVKLEKLYFRHGFPILILRQSFFTFQCM